MESLEFHDDTGLGVDRREGATLHIIFYNTYIYRNHPIARPASISILIHTACHLSVPQKSTCARQRSRSHDFHAKLLQLLAIDIPLLVAPSMASSHVDILITVKGGVQT